MWNRFLGILRWAVPIVIMVIAVIQLVDIPFPKWAVLLLLISSAILYTFVLIADKKKKAE